MTPRVTLAALSLAAALTLGGCSFAADATTSHNYDPANGLGSSTGSIRADNLVLVTTAEGEPAVLLGSLYNSGAEDVAVTVTVGEDSRRVVVDSMSSTSLGLGDHEVRIITDALAAPGGIASVTVSVDGSPDEVKQIPVLDGTLAEYASVLEQLATHSE